MYINVMHCLLMVPFSSRALCFSLLYMLMIVYFTCGFIQVTKEVMLEEGGVKTTGSRHPISGLLEEEEEEEEWEEEEEEWGEEEEE